MFSDNDGNVLNLNRRKERDWPLVFFFNFVKYLSDRFAAETRDETTRVCHVTGAQKKKKNIFSRINSISCIAIFEQYNAIS